MIRLLILLVSVGSGLTTVCVTRLLIRLTLVLFTFRAAIEGAFIWTFDVTVGGRGLHGTVPPPKATCVVL